jgi:cell division protein FtsQ
MSTEFYFETPDNLIAKKKSSLKIEKGLKRLLAAAAVILALELIWLFGVSPFFPFSTVEVNGFSDLTRDKILSLAGIDENSSYFSTNVNIIREKLSSHILVESAVVIKRFPDKLSIFAAARQTAAVTLTFYNSKQVMMHIDRNGVFYKIETGAPQEKTDIPVLSGIENAQLNMRLPSACVPLVKNLYEIGVSSPELLSAISEIRIERKAWDGYDLVIFPVHSSIRVRVENNLTEDTLKFMLLMLNVFENDTRPPLEIDFRSGMGSYRIKELS